LNTQRKLKKLMLHCNSETGQILLLTMVFVLLGTLIVIPLANYMISGLKSGEIFEERTSHLYAADAGIQDGSWQIKYDHLKNTCADYLPYDFAGSWSYALPETVNGVTTNVTIQNVWIPKDLEAPSQENGVRLISGVAGNLPKLILTTRVTDIFVDHAHPGTMQIKIQYYPEAGDDLRIFTLGIWLPPGFTYRSDLPSNIDSYDSTDEPEITDYDGGTAAVWDFSNWAFIGDAGAHQDAFPADAEGNPLDPGGIYPLTSAIYFKFDSQKAGVSPQAISWINTNTDLTAGGSPTVNYTWSGDTLIYHITSTAGNVVVDSYLAKNVLRQLAGAIAGDYYATGNSNLSTVGTSKNRTQWHDPSSASITTDNIPSDADVAAAYLYWTGWKNDNSISTLINDTCSNFNNWNAGNAWSLYTSGSNTSFKGHYDSSHTGIDIALASDLDLSDYSPNSVTISWDQRIILNDSRAPTGDGYASGTWTQTPGSPATAWDKVDESSENDSDYITGVSTTSGTAYKLFTFSPFSVPSGASISNLTIYMAAKRVDNSTSADIRASLKVNGAYYTGTTNNPSSSSFNVYSYAFNTNPATGSAWTSADINGTGTRPLQQFGIYSTDLDPDVRVSMVYAQVNFTGGILSSDGLDFSFSSDGGSHWSSPIQAFRGNIGTSATSFSYVIPDGFLAEGFRIKYSLVGNSCYVGLDNIKIKGMLADNSVVFKIDDGTSLKQVYLDEDDLPQNGNHELTASKTQVVQNFSGTSPHGFSYSSFRDVTALLRTYSQAPEDPAINWPGYATYWVGGISADASPADEWAYASWSIIIIYTSPKTEGHQLYLYDKFTYSNHDVTNGVNVDFDHDGNPGGTISGFIVPEPVQGVAHINVTNSGSGYTSAPTVTLIGGGGTGAQAIAAVASGHVTGIAVTSDGAHYTSAPSVVITGGGGTGAAATAALDINAGKLTTFVGEGDVWYGSDYLKVNGTKLWDGTNTDGNHKDDQNNVFNSASMGLGTYNGIDIDTFGIDPPNGEYITWDSNILNPGDTSAQIDIITHQDVWNLVYIIISFRTVTTTGGNMTYLIY
jgi:hypothetical protein